MAEKSAKKDRTAYIKKWRAKNRQHYRDYQREYRRKYRAAKKAETDGKSS